MDKKEELLKQQLQELKASYQQELPERLSEIRDLWQKITMNWSRQSLTALCTCLHRISGSAASFGYPELSVSAAKAEQLLKSYDNTDNIPDSNQLQTLTSALQQVFQYPG
ncbi:Hpt domain-containing protein [Thalassomonas actiniarum]|uniref:Hpt domain-containing protein n=1 Tax=Thalassomonas actiniarum TaxID=485447 RepID=A0AAF0C4A2_9GAMM|nr:Hpt domain-containing protein [Thalassomonas actiniarum]WDD99775.1 Hpt domain-containing protein [Thalassomonas actiniarum]